MCQMKDQKYHELRCDRVGEVEEKKMTMTPTSRKGLCGLQNLGNTCFMNSGLQCLSHVLELTEYFLSDKYSKEINETNPLGSNGKLAKKYASFLKSLWFGSANVHSPWTLKHAISDFQSMVSNHFLLFDDSF